MSVKPRKPKADPNDLVRELIAMMREQSTAQNAVLAAAMEAQKANADVLAKWMGMFSPSTTPLKSTTPDERAAMLDPKEDDWEPFDFSGEILPKDLN